MSVVAGFKVIPKGFTPVTVGKTTLLKKTGRRRKFKLSKATRNKIATSARKVKIPVLTIGANLVPALGAFNWLTNVFPSTAPINTKTASLFRSIITPYTGVWLDNNLKPSFRPEQLMLGLVPNLIVFGINRFGVFKSVNQKLAKSRLPIRLG